MLAPLSRTRDPFGMFRRRLTAEEAAERAAVKAVERAAAARQGMSRLREERAYQRARQMRAFHDARALGAPLAVATAIGEFVWYHYRALFHARRDAEKAARRTTREAEKASREAARDAERAPRKRPPMTEDERVERARSAAQTRWSIPRTTRTPGGLRALNRERVRRWRAKQGGA